MTKEEYEVALQKLNISVWKEFREILEAVPDSYYDFVIGVLLDVKTDEERRMVMEYIRNEENINSSKVMNFVWTKIRGEEPLLPL